MKKIKSLIIALVAAFVLSANAFAASGNLTVSSGSVYVGGSFMVTANVYSAAAWNVHVSASGPVSGCVINQADATADANDANRSFSATCTATGTGVITVTLSGDATSAAGNTVNLSGSRSVTVSERPAPAPTPTPSPAPTPAPSRGSATVDTRSRNNNLKELAVDGYNLVQVDANNYTLIVSNSVTSINVRATAEDEKASVTGTGSHDINVGENNIAIVVTAENGAQNRINLKVTRKDSYYLEDLGDALSNEEDVEITIKPNDIITVQDFEKIKASGKTVKFHYYNESKKVAYSWIVDGKKLNNINDLATALTDGMDNKKEILRLSNYADGLFVGLAQTEKMLAGLKLELFIGDKYEDGELVNVYAYIKSGSALELIKDKIKVENGYIRFDAKNATDYFITMSTIPSGSPLLPIIIVLILSLLAIALTTIMKNNSNKKNQHEKRGTKKKSKNKKVSNKVNKNSVVEEGF